ncbi:hypothetical protein JCM3770_005483 [Rhodotorula araucariae]
MQTTTSVRTRSLALTLGAYSPLEPADDMTSEQQAQMAHALSQVQAVLGPDTPIPHRSIQDALWDSYFDVDSTIAHLLDEQHKKEARRKKEQAATDSTAPAPPTASLASLSLDPSVPCVATVSTPVPKNKLAAKMAANRAAKAAAASAPLAPLPAASNPARAPEPEPAPASEKKLSKLQQKMLSARAARTPSSEAPAAAIAPPAPAGTEASPPRALDAAPPPAPLFAAPSVLVAAPSSFAAALTPRPGGRGASGAAPRAREIAAASSVTGGVAPAQVAVFGPSPDDRVLAARAGTALAGGVRGGAARGAGGFKAEARLAKLARKTAAGASSQPASAKSSRPGTPSGGTPGATGMGAGAKKGGVAAGAAKAPLPPPAVSALRGDMEAMGLGERRNARVVEEEEKAERRRRDEADQAPVVSVAKEKILEEVRAKEKDQKPVLSLVVVGHVDAGKSTLMGRVLHELGATSDKEIFNYQRQSEKIGKGSFAYAWTFDALEEERERGVTIDVAIDSFETPRRRFTLIDAPGHRDFIPNMISGAAQADAAVLVVDGSNGGFEKGFEGGGQTREHAVLVRSLGVQQLVVAVNKLDTVGWSQKRFEAIRDALQPFLTQTGFSPNKVAYVPVGAMSGENLTQRVNESLKAWYDGRSLVDELDALDVPARALDAPLRIPVSNVFKGQSATASGLAVSGRIESGIVQVGEKLAALPGDEAGVVRALEVEGELVPYALAGSNVTVFLAGIEANQLSVGSVLCPPSHPVPVVSAFTAQIIVFEPAYPITAGYAGELFHHSRDIPATIVALDAVLDKTTGAVARANPRMLTKGVSARIRVQLRAGAGAGGIPLEPFGANKGMGRVLFRRNGETVAAGIVLEVL